VDLEVVGAHKLAHLQLFEGKEEEEEEET